MVYLHEIVRNNSSPTDFLSYTPENSTFVFVYNIRHIRGIYRIGLRKTRRENIYWVGKRTLISFNEESRQEQFKVFVCRMLLGESSKSLEELKQTIKWYLEVLKDPHMVYKTFSASTIAKFHEIADKSPIARKLLDLPEWRFDGHRNITVTKDGTVRYLPHGKECVLSDTGKWSSKNRQEARIGKLVQMLLPSEVYATSEIEEFVNLIKAQVVPKGDFVIVQGEDIRKYYHYSTYHKGVGTLETSCMRYSSCQKYFDIYVENAKMLVYMYKNKIKARAILWEIDGNTYMDRIYGSDSMIIVFKNYAQSQGWYTKFHQSYKHPEMWINPNGDAIEKRLSLNIDKSYEYYPYMDTFLYLSGTALYNTPQSGRYRPLDNTNGSPLYTCCDCGVESSDKNDFAVIDDKYYCDDCYVYDVNGKVIPYGTAVYIDAIGEYTHEDNAVEVDHGCFELHEYVITCAHSGETYSSMYSQEFISHNGQTIHQNNLENYLEFNNLVEINGEIVPRQDD